MAFSSTDSKVSYTGNNSTVTAYSITFPYGSVAANIKVAILDSDGVETILPGSGYTVDTNNDELTTAVAYDSTNTVVIYREVAYNQELDLENGGDFDVNDIEEQGLDFLVFQTQQLARKFGLSVQFTESSTVDTSPLTVLSTSDNGIFGVVGGAVAYISASTLASWLNLPATVVDLPTKTFANAAARGTAVPDFLGQVGTQQDTGQVYVADGLTAGDWTIANPYANLSAHSGITSATKIPVDEGGDNKRSTVGAINDIAEQESFALHFFFSH